MTDIASRLRPIRAGLADLQRELTEAGQPSLAQRAQDLLRELDTLTGSSGSVPRPARRRKPARRRDEVEKCPRCTIRSLHPVPEQVREGADGAEEILWHCSSCGFEEWRDDA
ncbi:hypothetical protein TVNIR_3236 [Thioalkalivibrio nitratireducens DSM 14787]|uniref:Uncharacterized protein n=1 Tax=Thioalkalivibrio nitratireducens (strain DSM 14787 / UNIQEM 213 / ALEN2) TaxID=1255043 RepID=L0E0S6_THIND|nr:hypothetical protein [Thioalkalivibrio nitratireducens]AGA34873.1 hypothetical protein TVNIR_3236 [Thioalkalivibrio nitratireducens DSM 14787]